MQRVSAAGVRTLLKLLKRTLHDAERAEVHRHNKPSDPDIV